MLDECMITSRTMLTHIWISCRNNILIDNKSKNDKAYAVIVAASREFGIEYIDIYKNSVNKIKFKSFLDGYRSSRPFDDVILVMVLVLMRLVLTFCASSWWWLFCCC